MSLKKDYNINDRKMYCGPGGIACPCCNKYGCHPRKAKPLIRRRVRRTAKRNLVNS